VVSGKVKSEIRGAVPRIHGVLIHMEPYHGRRPTRHTPLPSAAGAARRGRGEVIEE